MVPVFRVRSLSEALPFYRDILGFVVHEASPEVASFYAVLSWSGEEFHLQQDRQPRRFSALGDRPSRRCRCRLRCSEGARLRSARSPSKSGALRSCRSDLGHARVLRRRPFGQHNLLPGAGYRRLSSSLISVSRSTSLGPPGASSGLRMIFDAQRTIRKMMNARMRKLTTSVTNCAPSENRGARFLQRGIVGHRTVIIGRDWTQHEEVAGEIEPTENLPDDRHDDVVGKAGHDLRERGADDHCNSQIENVSPGDECAEFLQHLIPLVSAGRQPICGQQQQLSG